MQTMLRACPSRHVLCALALGTGACGEADGLRRETLAHLADEVIVPAEARLQTDADALAKAVAGVCTGADIDAARTAWAAAHDSWSVTGAFAFGPVAEQMQAGPLDFWPVRGDTIEARITDAPAQIDAAYLATLGTSAKGLPALEYLLFGEPLAPASPRCAYAQALAEDVAARTADIADAWTDGHAEALRSAGHGSAVYPSEQAGLDAVVNAAIEGLYRMVKDKLDRPLGNLTGGDPDPALSESLFSKRGAVDLERNLDGFARVYLGADLESGGDPGLGALVAARDAGLDERIVAQLAAARAALAALPGTLDAALIADRSAVQTARDEVDGLRRLLKLDVASLLGVTLSLSDNDGD